jgi:hypothetical protein
MALFCIGAAMPVLPVFDLKAIRDERLATLNAFADPRRSPYAAIARHDFIGGKPLVVGSAPESDIRLEGVAPRELEVVVEGDHFLKNGQRLEPGARVEVGRYTLRFSHQNFPAVLVLDRESPRLKGPDAGPRPVWFEPDPALCVEAKLVPEAQPREEVVMSTRGNKRRALKLGVLEFTLAGKALRLTALRLLEPGVGEAAISVFFRDATTGKESYPVGRYVEPAALGGDRYVLDFNRAYNPSCAFSALYNCPIPPRENVLPVAIHAGERDPGGHAAPQDGTAAAEGGAPVRH